MQEREEAGTTAEIQPGWKRTTLLRQKSGPLLLPCQAPRGKRTHYIPSCRTVFYLFRLFSGQATRDVSRSSKLLLRKQAREDIWSFPAGDPQRCRAPLVQLRRRRTTPVPRGRSPRSVWRGVGWAGGSSVWLLLVCVCVCYCCLGVAVRPSCWVSGTAGAGAGAGVGARRRGPVWLSGTGLRQGERGRCSGFLRDGPAVCSCRIGRLLCVFAFPHARMSAVRGSPDRRRQGGRRAETEAWCRGGQRCCRDGTGLRLRRGSRREKERSGTQTGADRRRQARQTRQASQQTRQTQSAPPRQPARQEMSEIRSRDKDTAQTGGAPSPAGTTKRDTQISRALSKLLRHRAVEEGLAIDSNGFVAVEDLLKHRDLKCKHATLDDVRRVVETNSKKRFRLATRDVDGADVICALQGHSIDSVHSTPEMRQLDSTHDEDWPRYIVHGTYRSKLPLIKETRGLSRMARNHVHFSYTVPEKFKKHMAECVSSTPSRDREEAVSGLRSSCQVILLLDVGRVRKSGLAFYRSANDVILSPGDSRGIVGIEYIERIVDCEDGVLGWDDVGGDS